LTYLENYTITGRLCRACTSMQTGKPWFDPELKVKLKGLTYPLNFMDLFAPRIKKIQGRIWDLLPVIRNHVYHPKFGSSYSLKSVLPALVPGMSYDGMAVADGQAAGLVWESLIRSECGEAERQENRKALVEYCSQDTLGMVRLLEVIKCNAES